MSRWTISPNALRHVCPNLSAADAAAIAPRLAEAFACYGIDTPARAAMAVAQWGMESDHFRTCEEYASGSAYENNRGLGNVHPGDGKRYKGRGRIMITGRANYAATAKGLGIDCLDKPELLLKPPYSELASGYWWHTHNCNSFCDKGDFVGLTVKINGGKTGLAERQRMYALAKAVAKDLVPRDCRAVLSDKERKEIECLELERKVASRGGGWEKVDPSHLKNASRAKDWLKERKAEIEHLAKVEPGGWSKGDRRARHALICEAIDG